MIYHNSRLMVGAAIMLLSVMPSVGASVQPGPETLDRDSSARVELAAWEDTCMSPSLRGVVLPEDYGRLIMIEGEAIKILSSLGDDAYGVSERPMLMKLLTADHLDFTLLELVGYRRVRSIQVNDLGVYSYPYFSCRFRMAGDRVFFEKTSGSQRKSGYVYDNKPDSKVFLGGWSVNSDPQTVYGGPNSEAGMLYKIGNDRLIMLFVNPGRSFEIYELKKR